MIEFVSATRLTKDEFWEKSALGRSLTRIEPADHERFVARVAYENSRGLPAVFNERIEATPPDHILVFLHDDLWIDDLFICDHLEEAVHEFHVVGVSGNARRTPMQPSWAFRVADNVVDWDDAAHLRGAIAHGPEPFGKVTRYGPTYEECELLDGVFLAVRAGTLADSGLRFDTRFDFHFYDLDFCRSAREKGLRLGCWPVALTHQSAGNYRTPSWQAGYERYIAKWKS
jgi:GT2 family glycosyltransferase